jgi:hypothetical protein
VKNGDRIVAIAKIQVIRKHMEFVSVCGQPRLIYDHGIDVKASSHQAQELSIWKITAHVQLKPKVTWWEKSRIPVDDLFPVLDLRKLTPCLDLVV